jgi:hypothetical protein
VVVVDHLLRGRRRVGRLEIKEPCRLG